ncbi:MAG TPA: hypothetical protein VHR18_07475 [Solirubrobacterales bacterium]|nr:hypothetical protein [Solirubrobacterales bacterium]
MSPGRPDAGLCDRCRHQQLVPNSRGSVFSLCRRSREDERFRRYPPIPVFSCPGFEAGQAAADPEPRQ